MLDSPLESSPGDGLDMLKLTGYDSSGWGVECLDVWTEFKF
jgi:hypothetical protein